MVVTVSHVSVLDVCSLVFWFLCYTHTPASVWQSALLKSPGLHTACYQMILSVLRVTWLLLVLIALTVFCRSLTDLTLFWITGSTGFLLNTFARVWSVH